MEELKVFSNLSIEYVSKLIREFYLSRGFSDLTYLKSFEKWYLTTLENNIDSLEVCFLKTMFVSSTLLEIKHQKLRVFLFISLFTNLTLVLLLISNNLNLNP